jgi:hypothetical protein
MRPFILPLLGYAGYPMILLGAVAVFGLSSYGTLRMVSAQIIASTAPAVASSDFNLPPVQQIGSLNPPAAKAEPAAEAAEPESSIVAASLPDHDVAVAVAPPDVSEAPADALRGRIGAQAVNVRAGPSKTAVALGVLNAGTPVRIGESVGGWVHVFFDAGDGWVYKSFLETSSITSIAAP